MASPATDPFDRKLNADRLLLLEVRSIKIGFVVIQGMTLLDWGVRYFPAGTASAEGAIRILSAILKIHAPSSVVARQPRRVKHRSSEKAIYLFRKIHRELKRRSIPFVPIPRRDVSRFFARQGCFVKHEIEAFLGEQFGDLKPTVPKPRKLWDKERYAVPVFDALATGFYFRTLGGIQ